MHGATIRAWIFAWIVLLPTVLLPGVIFSDDFLPGQSHHGEAFDIGPRQSAYLMGGTGDVHFPVTTKQPLVQKFIEQGIGQLHGFWAFEAERSFRQAAALDPNCGIAYWGMAVASQFNEKRSGEFARQAALHKAGLTDREQMYIDALGNEAGYRAIIDKYPKDIEAKAFEVWRIWHKSETVGTSSADLEAAMKLSKAILSVDLRHPIHHAVIHIADTTNTEVRGLDSAARCGESAPSIGHMWHMPTHIYFALKRYPEAAWQLEASIRTEHARMMHDRILPDEVRLYAHNNEWLVRTLLHLGRVQDARRVASQMIDLPRHPLLNLIEPPEQDDSAPEESKKERPKEVHGTSAYYGRERLIQVLRRSELWDEMIEECRSGHIEPTRLPEEQGKREAAMGVAYYCLGQIPAGDRQLAEVHQLLAGQLSLRETALSEARQLPQRERVGAMSAVNRRYARAVGMLTALIHELDAYRAIAAGFFVSRTMLFVDLAALLLGEIVLFWLLRRRLVTAAVSVVATVAVGAWLFSCHLALLNLPYDSTNVDFAFVTRKQFECGAPEAAEFSARQFAIERVNQVRPQANLVEILYRVGKKDEARKEFDKLRSLAGTADLDAPPLARLAPAAHEFGFPTDWRLPQKIQIATLGRRSLPSLGPLRWRPWTAPDFKLADGQGKTHSLAEYRGKPVLLLFFLGNGCLHCKQQLHAFAKRAQEFKEAGLTVIAISTDDQEKVKKSLTTWGKEPFPFLMVADPDKQAFQSYRAYDNFEGLALHGTFLIDGAGLCRWHDVSFEPFMDAGFVLGESKRLLATEVAPIEPDARVIAETAKPPASDPIPASGPIRASGQRKLAGG